MSLTINEYLYLTDNKHYPIIKINLVAVYREIVAPCFEKRNGINK
jgi:hypothetical protein